MIVTNFLLCSCKKHNVLHRFTTFLDYFQILKLLKLEVKRFFLSIFLTCENFIHLQNRRFHSSNCIDIVIHTYVEFSIVSNFMFLLFLKIVQVKQKTYWCNDVFCVTITDRNIRSKDLIQNNLIFAFNYSVSNARKHVG